MKKTAICLLFLAIGTFGFAQQLEVRFDSEFQKDSEAKTILGGGASLIFDDWVNRWNFQLNFDYALYNSKTDYMGNKTKFNKIKAGASALYCIPLGEKALFRAGLDLSYNELKKINTQEKDSSYYYISHKGYMLGIGAIINLQYQLGSRVALGANVVPTYLIPLVYKTDRPDVESYYKKGFFILQFQIGLIFKLGSIETIKPN